MKNYTLIHKPRTPAVDRLANAIYLPRVPGRIQTIRRLFEAYISEQNRFDDPRPDPLHCLIAGMVFGVVVCGPIIAYLMFN